MRLRDLKPLREEALESKTAEALWAEGKDRAATYVSAATYQVRPVKGTKPTSYEVFVVSGTSRKPYGRMTSDDLLDTLKPIRPNQSPDAEGFTTYVSKDTVEAFQHDGDPTKVTLGKGTTATISKGDYLVRTVDGSQFVYSVEREGDFEATLRKA